MSHQLKLAMNYYCSQIDDPETKSLVCISMNSLCTSQVYEITSLETFA